MRSFINYIGGKSRLAAAVASRLPASRCYCEVFGGGAWVLFAREPSPVEIYNDIDGALANLYRVVRDRPAALARALRLLPRSRMVYAELRSRPPAKGVGAAAAYYYLIKNSFSGRPGAGFAVSSREAPKYAMDVDFTLWAKRLSRVTIEHLDFETCLRRYDSPDTVFYLDPPYWGKARYYAGGFGPGDHLRLRAALAGVRGRWLLSYNDCAAVRRLYRGFRREVVPTAYCASKVKGGARRSQASELLIANYEVGK